MTETVTVTLTEFLLARIAEDEAAMTDHFGEIVEWDTNRHLTRTDWDEAMISPRRILAECEAKRRIVEEHRPTQDGSFCGCCWLDDLGTWEPHPCPTLRAIALPYAGHPDYRDEWKP